MRRLLRDGRDGRHGSRTDGRAQPTELVNAQHCMFCHTSDITFLGPSFGEIADRYRGDPNVGAELERKLRVGGLVHWVFSQ
ncbi:c-type cytochrome [Burkholderia pyrrocinia]|uniref:c-type cytochrome n=1 Tax=Burkholderia pyrrocinia TaxID=60550 RepID=UPI001FC8278C|nr:hypothetical protein [Burkholderia pyrrocinia]